MALLVALALLSSSCVTTPDGRRVLSPAAKSWLLQGAGDALLCGASLVVGAASGSVGTSDYLEVSACVVERQLERAPALIRAASVAHGESVARATRAAEAYTLAPDLAHERELAEALVACDAVARAAASE